MIIFINGAFGAGKTTTAAHLQLQIHDAMIFDPEMVGIMLRELIPNEKKSEHERSGDFQDFDLWRVLTVKLIGEFKEKYQCDLIVPMTIRRLDYFEYIFNGVQAYDDAVFHFCLEPDKDTIHERLLRRGDLPNSWAFHQTDKCLDGFKHLPEKMSIKNGDLNVEEVVEIILNEVRNAQ